MSPVELDPQFANYLADEPRLTCVQPNDSMLRKFVVNRLELILGIGEIEAIYLDLKRKGFNIETFFGDALKQANITVNHLGISPQAINTIGPTVYLANHPFGILDGMVLCDIAAQNKGNLRILINARLCQDEDLAPHFLPIDFNESKNATKTNIRSKQLALQALADDIPLLVFPSGMVSTADKFGFGSVVDGPWTTFTAKLIRKSKATVVPVHFAGCNSRKFHIASHIAVALRTGLLMHEALKRFGSSVDVTIGEPLQWAQLESFGNRRELTDQLYRTVQQLGHKAN